MTLEIEIPPAESIRERPEKAPRSHCRLKLVPDLAPKNLGHQRGIVAAETECIV